jgi:hypothetical protein
VGTNAAGTGTATYTVTANNSAPDITATGAALGCGASVAIQASSSVSGATYSWTGPNGFSSTAQNPTVTAAGTYTVIVRNPATGCTASQSVTVTTGAAASAFWLEDFTFANGTLSDTGPTPWTATTTGTGTYSVQNNEFKTSFSGQAVGIWTSGIVDISGKSNTVISVNLRSETASSGDLFETADFIRLYYKLDNGAEVMFYEDLAGVGTSTSGTASATISSAALNGSTLQVIIRTSNSDPTERYYFDNVTLTGTPVSGTVTATGGSITCTHSSVTLSGSSSVTGVSYAWTGPNGFTSSLQNPVVSTAGVYTLTSTNPATGCSATDTANVLLNTSAPTNVKASAEGKITCVNMLVDLSATSSTAGVTYSWSGPNGYSTGPNSSSVASTSAAGLYTVTVTNPANGCIATDTVSVIFAQDKAQNVAISPGLAMLNCTNPVQTLTGSTITTGVSYSWTGPNGYAATGPTAVATTAGNYVLQVLDSASGCYASTTATINSNFTVPANVSAANNGPLTCTKTQVTLTGASTTDNVNFSWTGPGSFSSSSSLAFVSTPGTYTLTTVHQVSGCTGTPVTTVVVQDTTRPSNLSLISNSGSTVLNWPSRSALRPRMTVITGAGLVDLTLPALPPWSQRQVPIP